MTLFLATVAVFALVIAAMAVGVAAGRKPIAGSCGGLAGVGLSGDCEVCGGDRSKCERSA